MKITSIDIWTVVVPTIPGRVHSPEWVSDTGWDQVPKQILRLNTDTEHTGIGETGRGLAVDQVREGARLLLGTDPETLADRLRASGITWGINAAHRQAMAAGEGRRLLIDKYFEGREVEVDAVCDGETVIVPGIMEHIEYAGVHSGDSACILPPRTLRPETIETVIDYTRRLALALELLAAGELDVLFSGESRFDELPVVMASLASEPGDTLCHRIRYE